MKNHITIDDAIATLNSALELDRGAISELVAQRVKCNLALADHPTVQVQSTQDDSHALVGVLGLINGLFGVADDGSGPIAASIDGKGVISEFVRFRNQACES